MLSKILVVFFVGCYSLLGFAQNEAMQEDNATAEVVNPSEEDVMLCTNELVKQVLTSGASGQVNGILNNLHAKGLIKTQAEGLEKKILVMNNLVVSMAQKFSKVKEFKITDSQLKLDLEVTDPNVIDMHKELCVAIASEYNTTDTDDIKINKLNDFLQNTEDPEIAKLAKVTSDEINMFLGKIAPTVEEQATLFDNLIEVGEATQLATEPELEELKPAAQIKSEEKPNDTNFYELEVKNCINTMFSRSLQQPLVPQADELMQTVIEQIEITSQEDFNSKRLIIFNELYTDLGSEFGEVLLADGKSGQVLIDVQNQDVINTYTELCEQAVNLYDVPEVNIEPKSTTDEYSYSVEVLMLAQNKLMEKVQPKLDEIALLKAEIQDDLERIKQIGDDLEKLMPKQIKGDSTSPYAQVSDKDRQNALEELFSQPDGLEIATKVAASVTALIETALIDYDFNIDFDNLSATKQNTVELTSENSQTEPEGTVVNKETAGNSEEVTVMEMSKGEEDESDKKMTFAERMFKESSEGN